MYFISPEWLRIFCEISASIYHGILNVFVVVKQNEIWIIIECMYKKRAHIFLIDYFFLLS